VVENILMILIKDISKNLEFIKADKFFSLVNLQTQASSNTRALGAGNPKC